MEYAQSESRTVLTHLRTTPEGLSEKEAHTRYLKIGPNELVRKNRITFLAIFLNQFKDFLVLLLVFAILISLFLQEYIDALAMSVILALTTVLGFIQEYRAERAIEALESMSAPHATVIRSGVIKKIPAKRVVPGDIILLEAGDIVPADARILQSSNLDALESVLTGESTPRRKNPRILTEPKPIADQVNMVFMGTSITYGKATCVVASTGMSTQFGLIAKSIQEQKETQTPLQKKFQGMAKRITGLFLVLVAFVFILGLLTKTDPGNGGMTIATILVLALSLAVASVPSSLPAIVTIGLAVGTKNLARYNMIIKQLPAAESLGAVTVICSDKTGTITRNEMTVTMIWTPARTYEASGAGYDISGTITPDPEPIEPLLRVATLCNNAELILTKRPAILGDPTEGALKVLSHKAGFTRKYYHDQGFQQISEVPFDSERKRMSVIYHNPYTRHHEVYTKGAPEAVLNVCTHIMVDGRRKALTGKDRTRILTQSDAMAKQALRVLAFATKMRTRTKHENELTFLGMVGMIDPPRDEVPRAIEQCKQSGIRVMIITGDHALTAQAIAERIGLMEYGDVVITGEDLDRLSDAQLEEQIQSIRIIARAHPLQKLRVVTALQAHGHIVAVTGDGVNDSPALKRADVGIAMGTGTDVSKEVAKAILVDDNFASIVTGVAEGRNIYDKIIKSTRFLLSCNAGEIFTILIAIILFFPMPLLALHILMMNLVTDGLPALALGFEKADKDIMRRKPRDPAENPLSGQSLAIILIYGIIMALGVLFLFNRTLTGLIQGGMPYEQALPYAQTVAFSTLVAFEMFAVFGSRSLKPFAKLNPLSNPVLIFGVLTSILLHLLVVYTEFGQSIFSTVPLAMGDWMWIIAIGSIGLLTRELSKYFLPEPAITR